MTKGGKQEVAAVGHNSYAGTRFNAVKHAVLSRYTVLPWEDAGEYEGLFSAFVEEHMPEGPTETHLVEELAGIVWRKRRLRLAEASAMREGLHRATRSYSDTGEAALVCVSGARGDVGEAISIKIICGDGAGQVADTVHVHRIEKAEGGIKADVSTEVAAL